MRKDEIFMKDAIIEKYLKSSYNEFSLIEGDEPPDYYIQLKDDFIALELTQISALVSSKKETRNNQEYSYPICAFINQLNEDFGRNIKNTECLCFEIKYPICDLRTLKRKIRKEIHNIINIKDNSGEIFVDNDAIKWNKFTREQGKRIVAITMPYYENHESNIDVHVFNMVERAIKIKSSKMNSLNERVTQKWLAMYNDYFLASFHNFKRALDNYDGYRCFDKVFIINSDGDILILK